MLNIVWKSQFKKDFKKISKHQKNLEKLSYIVKEIQQGKALSAKYKNHKLKGDYIDCWECHIEPDWLLIYKIDYTQNELILIRTGSHSDLF